MNEQRFKSEIQRAETMRRDIDPDRADYWAGYIRGLRRLYHGEDFGTNHEHALWLSLIKRPDIRSQRRGVGYRDGLAYDKAAIRGRPSVGSATLPVLRLPADLALALEKRCKALKISLPIGRRRAILEFTARQGD